MCGRPTWPQGTSSGSTDVVHLYDNDRFSSTVTAVVVHLYDNGAAYRAPARE